MSVEEISPNLYRVNIPLPGSPLHALNSYVIRGERRSLVVDTGWNDEECKWALTSGLNELGVELSNVDFLITHLHADHAGLVSRLASDTARVYFGKVDADWIDFTSIYEQELTTTRRHGFPEAERLWSIHPVRRFSSRSPQGISTVVEGESIRVGRGYLFKCIETPGHSRSHICLYEPFRKILIAGDHLLMDITPNVASLSDEGNPLREYLASLDKVNNLDVELVLPGHGRIFRDHRERIRQLKLHHQERLSEVLLILGKGQQTAYQVASQMTWDVTYDSWGDFPLFQRWLAFGEALAHLRYLEGEGQVQHELQDEVVVYRPKPPRMAH